MAGTVSIRAAASIVKMKPAMVAYLCRIGVIRPIQKGGSGRGRERRFGLRELVLLRAIRELLVRGVSVKRVKEGLNLVRVGEDGEFPERFLVTDGRRVYARKSRNVVEDLEKGQYAFAFILDTRSYADEMRSALRLVS